AKALRSFLRRTRVRLTAVYAGVFLLVACAGATIFWVAFSRAELGTIDASLQAQQRYIAASIPLNPAENYADRDLLPNQNPVGIGISAVLLDDAGRLLDDSGQAPPARPLAPIVAEVRQHGQVLDSRPVDGERQ